MTLKEILWSSGGALVLILSFIQIAPIKVNPWSAIARVIGRAINGEVLAELEQVRATQKETGQRLDNHINADEKREADKCRGRILHFNNEILRDIPHTKEEFIEVLKDIDDYEAYCREHKDYENGRAVHAICNINRVYDDRLKNHDFLV